MTALIAIGIVLLLLLLLLCMPVAIHASLHTGHAAVKVRYLFVSIPLFPRKEKPPKTKPVSPQKTETKDASLKKPKKKKTLGQTVQMVRDLLGSARGAVRTLCRHLVFSHVSVALCVGGPDAHQTAMRYAQLSQIAALAFCVIGELFVLRKPQVAIAPDFTAPESRYALALRVSIRPVFVLAAAFQFLAAYLLRQAKRKRARPSTGQPSA